MAKGTGRARRSKKDKDAAAKTKMQGAAATSDGQPRLNIPTPKDLKHHYSTILGFKKKVNDANSNLRNAYSQAEAAGLDTQSIRDAVTKGKKDPFALRSYFTQLGMHLAELGLPFQIHLFDTIAGTPADQAYKTGYAVGEAGQTPNNIYPAGSSPHLAYNRGVAHGIGKNLGQTPEQVDAALADNGPAAQGEGDNVTKGPWPDDKQIGEPAGSA